MYLCLQLYFGLLRRQRQWKGTSTGIGKSALILCNIKSCSGQHLLYNKNIYRIDVTKPRLLRTKGKQSKQNAYETTIFLLCHTSWSDEQLCNKAKRET